MAAAMKRGVVVGASTALGKEIAERLNQSTAAAWDVSLVDAKAGGNVTSAGDEALVIAPLEDTSFAGADVVFFAGDAETTASAWKRAVAANAAVVDATRTITGEENVLLGAPSFASSRPDLTTLAMVPARPASWLLAVLARASAASRVVSTVLAPASNFGDAAMDELHAQTVALLSFQTQPREIFDAGVAFALRDQFGEASKMSLQSEKAAIEAEIGKLLADANIVTTSLIAAPVFHGLTASAWIETLTPLETIAESLRAAGVEVAAEDREEEITNQSVTESDTPMVRLRADRGGVWAWTAIDNLRWTAIAAESCALAMLALRPETPLQ